MRLPSNRHATSQDAAESVRPIVSTLVRRVFDFVQSCGLDGATDAEMQSALDLPGNTQRPRRRWLEQNGYVRDSGETRPTPSGRGAAVWMATGKTLPAEPRQN
ncbi:hypothetical protein GC176_00035 [bacterium]|nr:hypothetical protein [bacterium]